MFFITMGSVRGCGKKSSHHLSVSWGDAERTAWASLQSWVLYPCKDRIWKNTQWRSPCISDGCSSSLLNIRFFKSHVKPHNRMINLWCLNILGCSALILTLQRSHPFQPYLLSQNLSFQMAPWQPSWPRRHPASQALSYKLSYLKGSLNQAFSLQRSRRAVAPASEQRGGPRLTGARRAALPALHGPGSGRHTASASSSSSGRCGPPGPPLRTGRGGEAPPARAPERHSRDGGSAARELLARSSSPRCRRSGEQRGGEERRGGAATAVRSPGTCPRWASGRARGGARVT